MCSLFTYMKVGFSWLEKKMHGPVNKTVVARGAEVREKLICIVRAGWAGVQAGLYHRPLIWFSFFTQGNFLSLMQIKQRKLDLPDKWALCLYPHSWDVTHTSCRVQQNFLSFYFEFTNSHTPSHYVQNSTLQMPLGKKYFVSRLCLSFI